MRERCKGGDPACLSLSHSHKVHKTPSHSHVAQSATAWLALSCRGAGAAIQHRQLTLCATCSAHSRTCGTVAWRGVAWRGVVGQSIIGGPVGVGAAGATFSRCLCKVSLRTLAVKCRVSEGQPAIYVPGVIKHRYDRTCCAPRAGRFELQNK